MKLFAHLQQAARRIKHDAMTVYFVARDRQTPWHVRGLALAIAAYALSPIDLIPDFIPVLGYLDDVILLPLGIFLVIKLTPAEVIEASRMVTNRAVPVVIGDRRPGDAAALVSSSQRAVQDLGWEPQHSTLRQMIGDAWAWAQKPGFAE